MAGRPSGAWERYAWAAGVVYVVALVSEVVVSAGTPLNQDDSAAKIAKEMQVHEHAAVVVACLSVVYAPMFVIYLWKLYTLLRGDAVRPPALASLVLVGGMPFVALHAVSDIGIMGMLGAKLSSYDAQHDPGMSYTLYLLTFALDSVGDVFGSVFAFATGMLVIRSGVLPRWLGWVAIAVAACFFLQGFGLGGVIAWFGLVLDLVGFLLFLVFVLVSSVILLRRDPAVPHTAGRIE